MTRDALGPVPAAPRPHVTGASADDAGRRDATDPLLDVLAPAGIRAAATALQLIFVLALNHPTSNSLASRFTIWDGRLYTAIAAHGYPRSIVITDGHLTTGTSLAFHPVYPAAIAVLHGITGLDGAAAAVVVSLLSGLALSVLVHLIVLAGGGTRRAGYLAATLIGVLPMSVVLQMAYAEALFAALSAAALYAAVRRRWLTAGALVFLAGLTRPVGYVALAPVAVLAMQDRLRHRRAPLDAESTAPARTTAALALGLAGSPAWWAVVGIVTGRPLGWFAVQRAGWGTHFDGGRATVSFVWSTFSRPSGEQSAAAVAACCVLLGFLAVTGWLALTRQWAYLALALTALASVALSTNYWHSKPRLLLCGLLVVVPVARHLATISTRSLAVVIGSVFVVSAWFGAFMLTQWPYAI